MYSETSSKEAVHNFRFTNARICFLSSDVIINLYITHKIANNIILCLLSQICFVFDNCNLQHTRNLPIGFAFFLFCHHSTKCDKQCQKDFQEHLCSFSVKAKGASAKADAPLCASCASCKRADYLPLLFRRGMVSVFVSLQTVQV